MGRHAASGSRGEHAHADADHHRDANCHGHGHGDSYIYGDADRDDDLWHGRDCDPDEVALTVQADNDIQLAARSSTDRARMKIG